MTVETFEISVDNRVFVFLEIYKVLGVLLGR